MAIVSPILSNEFTLKTGEFVSLVLRKLGAVGAGESVSAEDYAEARNLVMGSLMALHADGLLWFAVKAANVAFTGATAARPSDCVECVYASWGSYPVRLIDRMEYERIQDKAEAGRPEVVFDDGAELTLWPVPDSGDLRLTYQRELLATDQGQELDVPKPMIRPLVDYMAYEIAPWFDVPVSMQARIVQDGARAAITIRKLAVNRTEQAPVQAEYL